MKNIFLFATPFLICLFTSGCVNNRYRAGNNKLNVFEINVLQSGKIINISDHVVKLKKAPFQLEFRFHNNDFVAINASFNSLTFQQIINGTDINKMATFAPGNGISDGSRNESHDVTVRDSGFNSWYFNSDTDNRFDLIVMKDGKRNLIRTIDSLGIIPEESGSTYNYDKHGNIIAEVPISELKENSLYLVILSWKYKSHPTRYKELQRDWIKIEFFS